MPKELTHWILAEKACSMLEENIRLKKILLKYRNVYRIGAVVMDSPSYVFANKNSKYMNNLAREMHNTSEGSYQFVIKTIKKYKKVLPEYVIAFISGIISHIIVDGCYHPFIYYFSGLKIKGDKKASHKAVFRHRAIETLIDLYYMRKEKIQRKWFIYQVLKNIEINKEQFFNLLHIFFNSQKEVSIKHIKQMLQYHKLGQSLFFHDELSTVLRFFSFLPGIDLKLFIALFYSFNKNRTVELFSQPLKYRHPVTGIVYKTSLEDLKEDTACTIYKALIEIDSYLQKDSILKFFIKNKGFSAFTGMVNKGKEDMKYFDTERNLEKICM